MKEIKICPICHKVDVSEEHIKQCSEEIAEARKQYDDWLWK